MRKNYRLIYGLLLFLMITTTLFNTIIFADDEDGQQTKVIYTKACDDKTYYITEDGSLFVSNEQSFGFDKIYENAKAVFPYNKTAVGECLILTRDGELLLFESKFPDGEGYNERVFSITNNVKDVSINNYNYDYILKNDGTLYRYLLEYVDGEIISKNITITNDVKDMSDSPNYNCVFVVKEDGSLFTIGKNNSKHFYGNMEINFDEPIKVMDNVSKVLLGIKNCFILDNYGNLFNVGEFLIYRDGTFNEPNLIAENVIEFDSDSRNSLYIIKKDSTLWRIAYEDYVELVLTEFDNNVSSVSDSYTNTTYVTNDYKLFGLGEYNNGQLGDIKYSEFFDENGFYEVMSDVQSVSLKNQVTTVVKNDNTLWAFGNNDNNIIANNGLNTISTPIKIAENVLAGEYNHYLGTIQYIDLENQLKYKAIDNYLYLKADSFIMPEVYMYFFSLLGLQDLTYEEVLNYEFDEEFYSKYHETELIEFDKKVEDFYITLSQKYKKDVYAFDVKQLSGYFYLNNNNEVYKKNYFIDDRKVASDVIFIEATSDKLFIINDKNELYYADLFEQREIEPYNYYMQDIQKKYGELSYLVNGEYNIDYEEPILIQDEKEELDFIKIETNSIVKEVKFLNDSSIFILTDSGLAILNSLSEKHEFAYYDRNGELDGYIYYEKPLNVKDIINSNYYTYKIFSDRIEFYDDNKYIMAVQIYDDILYIGENKYTLEYSVSEKLNSFTNDRLDSLLYIDENDCLYGIGYNNNNIFGYQENYYYSESQPAFIMDNVKAVVSDNLAVLVLKNDGTLIAMGKNNMGELGFVLNHLSTTVIEEPIEIKIK